MKKRTLIHCLPAAAAAAGNLLQAAPKQGLNRVKRGLDLKGTQPVYTAVLTADLHTDADPCRDRTDVLRLAFSGVTRFVGRPDVFVMAGDITNCGDEKEYRLLRRLTGRYLRAKQLLPALGNHDSWHHSDNPCWEVAYRLFRDLLRDCGLPDAENYYRYEDAYCNYLVLGTERTMHNSAYLSDAQLDWLDRTLAVCAKQKKFIFIINHQPLHDRNGGDSGWEEEGQLQKSRRLEQILLDRSAASRAQVCFVSGHKHSFDPTRLEAVTDRLYCLNLPSFEYGGDAAPPGSGYIFRIFRNGGAFTAFDFIRGKEL